MRKTKDLTVQPNDDGIRPAGPPDACLYCKAKVGELHRDGCVMIQKTVKVRYSFDIEITVPYGWSPNQVEFSHNESSWCADNALDEIQEIAKALDDSGGCMCGSFNCKFLGEVGDGPWKQDGRRESPALA